MKQLADHFELGRTAIVRYLGEIRKDPTLIKDDQVRLLIHRRKRLFMGRFEE